MKCYIGVGANIGDREKNISEAVQKIQDIDGVEVKKISPLYETEPVGGPDQPKYLNGVLEIETDFSPRHLLDILHDIENRLGRERTVKNGPRTIDLDILTYGDSRVDEPDLKIPHPRMAEREFVQKPLSDLLDR
jgi:2-amino-4-hydroxy-6-hydroxymethyldihydropteridine diphosphokinase